MPDGSVRRATLVSTLSALFALGCNSGGSAGDDAGPGAGRDGSLAGDAAAAGDAGLVPTDAGPPGDAGEHPRFSMDDVAYQGAFRLRGGMLGASSVDFAVGTLAYHAEHHSLFVVGHDYQNAVGEFPIPSPSMASDVSAIPEGAAPLQPFVEIFPAGSADGRRVTGMLVVDGALIVNSELWYDAGGTNVETTQVIADANDLAGSTPVGFFELEGAAHSAGYMGVIPAPYAARFGGGYYSGWSSVYSIVSRYSVGPSLFVFAPADLLGAASPGPVDTVRVMDFPHGEHMIDPRAVEMAAQGTPGPYAPASPLWNILSRGVYGFFVPGTSTFMVIGQSGGVETGIGYKAIQSDGYECPGPCPYGPDDHSNYYWLFDVEEILAAEDPWDPRPYDYGAWELPHDDGGAHGIIGATLDPEGRVLYVALDAAGQVGEYDRPPLILAYQL